MISNTYQNTPRPSGHKKKKLLGGIKGYKYRTSSWHLNGSPDDGDNIGSTAYIREKPTVILYTYINRHAGHQKASKNRTGTMWYYTITTTWYLRKNQDETRPSEHPLAWGKKRFRGDKRLQIRNLQIRNLFMAF